MKFSAVSVYALAARQKTQNIIPILERLMRNGIVAYEPTARYLFGLG